MVVDSNALELKKLKNIMAIKEKEILRLEGEIKKGKTHNLKLTKQLKANYESNSEIKEQHQRIVFNLIIKTQLDCFR
jgi:hypothetical protein